MRACCIEQLEGRQLLAYGQIDTSWAESGRSSFNASAVSRIQDLSVTPGGAIFAGGDGYVGKFSALGVSDTSFGGDGFAPIPSGTVVEQAFDAQGNTVVLIRLQGGGSQLIKLAANGSRVNSFGSAGARNVGGSAFAARALSIQSDGKILVCGDRSTTGRGTITAVYRFTANGSPDSGFGSNGVSELQFATGTQSRPTRYDRPLAIAPLPGGKIALAVLSTAFKEDRLDDELHLIPGTWGEGIVTSARLNSNGGLDTTFDADGKSAQTPTTSSSFKVFAELDENQFSAERQLPVVAAIRPNGSVVVAGLDDRLTAVEFTASGSIAWTSKVDSGFPLDLVRNMVLLNDGRAMVIGQRPQLYPSIASGPTLVSLSDTGVFGNAVFVDDMRDGLGGLRVDSFAAARASDGKLVIGGADDASSNSLIVKVKIGSKSDARPDEFVGAQNNDLVVDVSRFNLHLAFYDAGSKVLKYAFRGANGLWNAPVIVDSTPFSGIYLSVALDSRGQPRVAYYEGSAGDLKYAVSNDFGRTWKAEVVDSKGSTGQHCALQIAPQNDLPLIGFYRRTSGDLLVGARKTPGKWSFDVVDSTGDVGRSVSFQLLNGSLPLLAYVDTTNKGVKTAFRRPGVGWELQTIATTTGGADYVSLSTEPDPFVTFYDAGPADLRVARGAGLENFVVTTVATRGAVGLYSDATYGSAAGKPWVFAYDKTSNQVQLYGNATSPSVVSAFTFTVATGGGRFLSTATVRDLSTASWIAYYSDDIAGLKVRSSISPTNDGPPLF